MLDFRISEGKILKKKENQTIKPFQPLKLSKALKRVFSRSISHLRTKYLVDSLGDKNHPINKYLNDKEIGGNSFLPYINERDSLNHLLKVINIFLKVFERCYYV